MRLWPKFVTVAVVVALATSLFVGWRAVRKEQAELKEHLKIAEQALKEANARQERRDVGLNEQLKRIQAQKQEVQRPEQVLKALPEVLPLPKEIVVEPRVEVGTAGRVDGRTEDRPLQKTEREGRTETVSPGVQLPAEDLKPLYDFAMDCKACQARLATVQADLKDEKAKTEALGKERDAALKVARGGPVWKRVARAAKWFAIGAAAGAVAAKMMR